MNRHPQHVTWICTRAHSHIVLFVLQFANAHGNSEITTLAQDATETRLFTASADGTVKVRLYWIFRLFSIYMYSFVVFLPRLLPVVSFFSVSDHPQIWDFNGHCHHILMAGNGSPAEISQVLCLKRIIIVVGWDRQMAVFRDSQMNSFYVYPSDWKGRQVRATQPTLSPSPSPCLPFSSGDSGQKDNPLLHRQ